MPLTEADHIRSLLGTYCRLIDAADFAGIGQLMADAVLMTEEGAVIATGALDLPVTDPGTAYSPSTKSCSFDTAAASTWKTVLVEAV